jgi:molybdopterin synthase sulfur carrier subunit
MVTLLYFARLRETLGLSSEQVELPATVQTVGHLTDWLRERGGPWATELAAGRPVRAAVNQVMAGTDSLVKDGDEIAFFPPVTGG